jgi:hypothetical protein
VVFLLFSASFLSAQTYFGNQCLYSTVGTLAMGSGVQHDIRFTMPDNNSVSIISIPGNVSAASTAVLQFGIQSDDGTASHFPSGTWLCESAPTKPGTA